LLEPNPQEDGTSNCCKF